MKKDQMNNNRDPVPQDPGKGTDALKSDREPRPTPTGEATGSTQGIIIIQLAELPEKALLDQRALAKALKVTKRTIRRMVARYEIPPGTLLGGRKRWQAGQVLRWFEAKAERLIKVAEKAARKFRSCS